jgi:hypothetical protein
MKTGDSLTNANVFQTRTGTPPHLNLYAFDVCGVGAVVHGIKDALDGTKVVFAAATRIDCEPPIVVKTVAIHQESIGDSKVLQWSDGGSVVGSYVLDLNPKEIHLALLTGVVVNDLTRGDRIWLFRLPDLY